MARNLTPLRPNGQDTDKDIEQAVHNAKVVLMIERLDEKIDEQNKTIEKQNRHINADIGEQKQSLKDFKKAIWSLTLLVLAETIALVFKVLFK